MSAASRQPQDQGKNDAQQDGRGQREIKRCVLAAVDKIAGKTAQRQIELARDQEQGANQNDGATQHEQHFAQLGHKNILAAGLATTAE